MSGCDLTPPEPPSGPDPSDPPCRAASSGPRLWTRLWTRPWTRLWTRRWYLTLDPLLLTDSFSLSTDKNPLDVCNRHAVKTVQPKPQQCPAFVHMYA